MNSIKIVHVEDERSQRILLSEVLTAGFKCTDKNVEIRSDVDFSRTEADVKSGNLADVYILDNEITANREVEGGDIAQRIHDRACDLDRQVVIITLLASHPEAVRQKFGENLSERKIPVLHKLMEAEHCFFYIGACLNSIQEKGIFLDFEEWIRREGVLRPSYDLSADDVGKFRAIQARLFGFISINPRGEGAFWQSPSEFIGMNRELIASRGLIPQEIELMNSMFPRRSIVQEREVG